MLIQRKGFCYHFLQCTIGRESTFEMYNCFPFYSSPFLFCCLFSLSLYLLPILCSPLNMDSHFVCLLILHLLYCFSSLSLFFFFGYDPAVMQDLSSPTRLGVLTTVPPGNSLCSFSNNWSTGICCYSVAQSCLTFCDSMDCSTPGFPVIHCLPELAQTHVH